MPQEFVVRQANNYSSVKNIEAGTGGIGFTSGTATYEEERLYPWVGNYNGALTCTVAGTMWAQYTGANSGALSSYVVAGQDYLAVARVFAPVGMQYRMSVMWDATVDVFVDGPLLTGTGQYEFVSLGVTAPNPLPAGYSAMRVRLTVPAATVGQVLRFDGLEIRDGLLYLAPYIDEDQPGCREHDTNPSWATRDAAIYTELTPGRQGTPNYSVRLERRTINNVFIEDVSDYVISAGQVDFDAYRDVPMQFGCVVRDPDKFRPYEHFVAPFMDIDWPDGSRTSHQCGLFQVQPMRKTTQPSGQVGQLVGFDLIWVLHGIANAYSESVSVGTIVTDRIRTELENAGITNHAILPSAEVITGQRVRWEPATTKDAKLNSLAEAIGYYALVTDLSGAVTTEPYKDYKKATVAAQYVSGKDSVTLAPYESSLVSDGPYNVVVVLAPKQDGTFITAAARNTNPQSPTSTARIGVRAMPAERNDKLTSQATVTARARQLLALQSTVRVEYLLRTMPEPWHRPHEIYEVYLRDRSGKLYNEAKGRFYCVGWKMGLTPGNLTMEHRLYRILNYTSEV